MYDICRLQTADCRPQTADCRLQTADCRLQTAVCSLQSANVIHREPIVDEGVYFLHFYGEVNGKLHGKAVSFSTIRKNMPLQELHNGLASALAEVREYKDDSTTLG